MSRIQYVATHLGASAGGETLIERAVNESQRNNHDGLLFLKSVPEHRGFYEALGFTMADNKDMVLDPSTRPDIWTKDESTQKWTLNKHAGRGYLSANPA
jgi:hypothetical protein